MTPQDLQLRCSDCKSDFAFTASEQDEFAAKGFTNKPGRCPACRAARKARNGDGAAPGTLGRGPYAHGRNNSFGSNSYESRSDRGNSYDGGSSRGSSYGSDRETFEAVCSTCGKVASLPFQPSGDRPVYCRNCFKPRPSSR
jgi:CxxC-x17-CxxC domain-containing protein